MTSPPSRFALHAMYSSFIKKWTAENTLDYKDIESDWIELTKNISDEQIRRVTALIVEEMTGFPGTIHLEKYITAVLNDTEVEQSLEEMMAKDIIDYVCSKYPSSKYKYRVSDALEIAASVLYVHDNKNLKSDTDIINKIHIMPRKEMFLIEASKWVADSLDEKGKWVDTIKVIDDTYNA